MNLNKVFAIGRLTADPELRTTPSGQSVATFTLATNRVWTDKQGQKQEESEFHRIVVWGKQAETAHTYLKKGSEALIEGRLQTRSWDDKKTGIKRYTTEIVADRVQFGARPAGTTARPAPAAPAVQPDQPEAEDFPVVNVEGDEITDEAIAAEDLPFN